jgi:hypothetical protein
MVGTPRSVQLTCCIAIGCLLLLLLVPALYFGLSSFSSLIAPRDSENLQPITPPAWTTTTQHSSVPRGSCVVWGDPHVKVFDVARLNSALPVTFLENGDFWLVKTDSVWIQGRFEATTWRNGLASMHGVAVGGPFLNNHKIIIGPRSGKVYYNNQQILASLSSTFASPGHRVRATYREREVRLDNNAVERVATIELSLPQNIWLRVNRWDKHVDADIHMNPIAGQDGVCGNFNRNVTDDTKALIQQRVPGQAHVPDNQRLFPKTVFNTDTPEPYSPTDCDQQLLAQATENCRAANRDVSEAIRSACVLDVCRYGMQYANQDAATLKMAGR